MAINTSDLGGGGSFYTDGIIAGEVPSGTSGVLLDVTVPEGKILKITTISAKTALESNIRLTVDGRIIADGALSYTLSTNATGVPQNFVLCEGGRSTTSSSASTGHFTSVMVKNNFTLEKTTFSTGNAISWAYQLGEYK